MGRPGKRERARVKNRRSRRVRISTYVSGADLVTGTYGRKHLERHGRWSARKCVTEHAAFRMRRHLGGNRQATPKAVSPEDGRSASTGTSQTLFPQRPATGSER